MKFFLYKHPRIKAAVVYLLLNFGSVCFYALCGVGFGLGTVYGGAVFRTIISWMLSFVLVMFLMKDEGMDPAGALLLTTLVHLVLMLILLLVSKMAFPFVWTWPDNSMKGLIFALMPFMIASISTIFAILFKLDSDVFSKYAQAIEDYAPDPVEIVRERTK